MICVKDHLTEYFGMGSAFIFRLVDTISDVLKGDVVDVLISLDDLDPRVVDWISLITYGEKILCISYNIFQVIDNFSLNIAYAHITHCKVIA